MTHKKTLLSLAVACLMAVLLAVSFGIGGSAVYADDAPKSENLVGSTTSVLKGYQVDGNTYLPYPDDWNMFSGKVEDGYTWVQGDGTARAAIDGVFFASELPLTASLAEVTDYDVIATVKPTQRGGWGGLGILIGWTNVTAGDAQKESPVVLWFSETPQVVISAGGTEWNFACAFSDVGVENSSFALNTEMNVGVAVRGSKLTIYFNSKELGTVDTTTFNAPFTISRPAIGPAFKNYTGLYTNLELYAYGEQFDNSVAISDFAEKDNLAVDSVGTFRMYNLYNADAGDGDFGLPYLEKADGTIEGESPANYSLCFKKTSDGYTNINNDMQPYYATYPGIVMMPLSKDVSTVTDAWMVSAKIKSAQSINWGGLGLVVAKKAEADNAKSAVTVWVNQDGGVMLATMENAWKGQFGTVSGFDITKEYVLAVVVNGSSLDAYVNGEKVGTVDLGDVTLSPAVGPYTKNHRGVYNEFTLKTLADTSALNAASYQISYYSGSVKIGSVSYTYDAENAFTLNGIDRDGYQFDGWHCAPSMGDAVISEIPAGTGGSFNLYGAYSEASYTIEYYDGDTKIEGNPLLVYGYRSTDYVDLYAVTKEGYTFEGWYETADFSGEAVTSLAIGSTGNKVFYAKYVANSQGGNGGEENKGGCGSSIEGIAYVGFALLFCGAFLVAKKKRG